MKLKQTETVKVDTGDLGLLVWVLIILVWVLIITVMVSCNHVSYIRDALERVSPPPVVTTEMEER